MQRTTLLEKLDVVQPALGVNYPETPILGHYWFTGKHLLAYNNAIALQVPFASRFKGALPKHLHTILSTLDADDIEIVESGPSCSIQVGRNKYDFPKLGTDSFSGIFTMPDGKKIEILNPDDPDDHAERKARLLSSLQCCMLSMSDDRTRPEYMGVTVIPTDNTMQMYATDGKTMARSEMLVGDLPIQRAAMLPNQFCQQMFKLLSGEVGAASFGLYEDHVLFTVDGVTLYGSLIGERNIDFQMVFGKHLSDKQQQTMVPVPDRLRAALQRACIFCTDDNSYTQISVSNGQMKMLSANAQLGVSTDYIKVAVPDLMTKVIAKRLLNGMMFEEMLISSHCISFARYDKMEFYLVSCSS